MRQSICFLLRGFFLLSLYASLGFWAAARAETASTAASRQEGGSADADSGCGACQAHQTARPATFNPTREVERVRQLTGERSGDNPTDLRDRAKAVDEGGGPGKEGP